jgi:hypothetical protein
VNETTPDVDKIALHLAGSATASPEVRTLRPDHRQRSPLVGGGGCEPRSWSASRIGCGKDHLRTDDVFALGYSDVDSWTVRHEFPCAGELEGSNVAGRRYPLRSGHHRGGNAVSDSEITFDHGADPLPTRVDGPTNGRSGPLPVAHSAGLRRVGVAGLREPDKYRPVSRPDAETAGLSRYPATAASSETVTAVSPRRPSSVST